MVEWTREGARLFKATMEATALPHRPTKSEYAWGLRHWSQIAPGEIVELPSGVLLERRLNGVGKYWAVYKHKVEGWTMNEVVKRMMETRTRLGLSQEAVAEQLSAIAGYRLRSTRVNVWERGKAAPNVDKLKIIGAWLDKMADVKQT
jgi:hypothetical protein